MPLDWMFGVAGPDQVIACSNLSTPGPRLFLVAGLFGEMEADVLSLIADDMNGNLFSRLYFTVFAEGRGLGIGIDEVIGGADRDALGEFALRIGGALIIGFLCVGAANEDADALDGGIIGTKDGAVDERIVGFRLSGLLASGGDREWAEEAEQEE